MFHIISGALMAVGFLYLYFRCIAVLRIPRFLKIIFCVVTAIAAFKLQIFRLVFSGSVVQELPESVLVASGWLYAVVILWILLSLALDAALGVRWIVHRLRGGEKAAPARRRTPGVQEALVPSSAAAAALPSSGGRAGLRVGALLGAACLLAALGVWQAVRVPDVRRVDLHIANLPPALQGLRVVQLSDLHISPLFRRPWVGEVVTRVNALRPDLVLLTGDMVDGSPQLRAADVAPLAWLHSRYGVFACMGNHEYYSGVDAWERAFEGLGIQVLRNAHAALAVGDATLVLGGVTDPAAARFAMEEPDVARAFAGSPEGWRLLMAHQPVVKAEADQRVGLQLSGHTHGGQLFPVSLLVAFFNKGFLHGVYRMGDTLLYVSRGVGLWGGFPVRLGAPAEITELVLHGDAAAAGTAR